MRESTSSLLCLCHAWDGTLTLLASGEVKEAAPSDQADDHGHGMGLMEEQATAELTSGTRSEAGASRRL